MSQGSPSQAPPLIYALTFWRIAALILSALQILRQREEPELLEQAEEALAELQGDAWYHCSRVNGERPTIVKLEQEGEKSLFLTAEDIVWSS